MDYQRIKCFLKASETLNFSEAARSLFISPQAFGKQISLLEKEIGVPLFERGTRQIRLTLAGQECYERLVDPFRILEKEYDQLVNQAERKNRLIRIGVFNALSRKKVVSPIVSRLISEFSDRDISISMYDMGLMQQEINAGKMDLGIMCVHDTAGGWENCEEVVLGEYPARIVVAGNHPWVGKEQITVEDMKEQNFVRMVQPKTSELDYFNVIPCKKAQAVEFCENMYLCLDQGNCFTIMPYQIDSLSEQEYVTFDLPWHPFSFRLALMYHKDYEDDFIKEVCRFILKEFKTIDL